MHFWSTVKDYLSVIGEVMVLWAIGAVIGIALAFFLAGCACNRISKEWIDPNDGVVRKITISRSSAFVQSTLGEGWIQLDATTWAYFGDVVMVVDSNGLHEMNALVGTAGAAFLKGTLVP